MEGGEHRAATFRDARLPAWLASAVVHAGLFVLVAVLWRQLVPKSLVRAEPDRKAGVRAVEVVADQRRYLQPTSSAASWTQAAQTFPQQSVQVATQEPPVDLPREPVGQGPAAASGVSAATQAASTGRPSRGIAGQGHTSVFGAEGLGSKFLYVFDRSGSMNGFAGRPLAAAKSQLLESLRQLQSTHQFQIIFYNERPAVFNPNAPQPPRLLFADEQSKRLAESFVRGITATGGSHHYEALLLAVNMQPDVIFFLTDGQENAPTSSQLDRLLRQAARSGTTIHTIEFGVGPAAPRTPFLVYLASQTGGQYVYVDVSKLPQE
jgi:hypothetical protein